eukprot:1039616-Rhodomonas_salina.5
MSSEEVVRPVALLAAVRRITSSIESQSCYEHRDNHSIRCPVYNVSFGHAASKQIHCLWSWSKQTDSVFMELEGERSSGRVTEHAANKS